MSRRTTASCLGVFVCHILVLSAAWPEVKGERGDGCSIVRTMHRQQRTASTTTRYDPDSFQVLSSLPMLELMIPPFTSLCTIVLYEWRWSYCVHKGTRCALYTSVVQYTGQLRDFIVRHTTCMT